MVTNIVVATGYTGYRHQLDRARRFLERMEAVRANEVEFQDMVWAFFQNCWHVKDWVDHDPLVTKSAKAEIRDMALKSVALEVCQQLCNGTKHLGEKRGKRRSKKPVAKHLHVEMNIDSDGRVEMDCVIDNGAGKPVSGRMLAQQCIAEWVSILQSQGLITTRSS